MDINKREQIDEVKINMFFVLYNGADYNNEFYQVIDDKQNFVLKRIVYQNYSIKENVINFEKKNYIFIPIKTEKDYIEFIDENKNIITVEKKKKSEEKRKDKKKNRITMKINNINILFIYLFNYINNNPLIIYLFIFLTFGQPVCFNIIIKNFCLVRVEEYPIDPWWLVYICFR